jgi:hypothetical protein
MYDYIIIGGGIAGLYASLLLFKSKTLLLEKNNYFGGRTIDKEFHGVTARLGAGIASPDNKYLLNLLNVLKIKVESVQGDINIIDQVNMKKMVNQIIKKYKSVSDNEKFSLTSREFIEKHFGKEYFKLYSTYTEYTDFFDSSIESYVEYYDITDHIPSEYTLIFVDWNQLITKLISFIKKHNQIKKNYKVDSVKYDSDKECYIINSKYKAKNVICACTIKSMNILNELKLKLNYEDYIGYVPFIRIYTYHKNGHNLNIERYNILNSKLHKIVVLSDKVLMISYSDNQNALYWKKHLTSNNLEKEIKKLFNTDLKIDDILVKYWEEGIHYFKPNGLSVEQTIKKLQNPMKGLYIGGEMLSKRQGWVEGSLESINRIYKLI